jgi:predicted dehydrogenase
MNYDEETQNPRTITMPDQPLRLGVIGMGPNNMASTLVLLRDAPDLRYRITAICGLPANVIERCAREFETPFWTTDYRELVARQDVDVVCVFSPDALHAEHCIAALEHGKHVVCTKPMVTRREDAQRLVELVCRKRVKFLVGQTMRFDRQFLHAQQLFDSGQLGAPIALESHYVHDMRPVFGLTPWRLTMPQDFMFGGCVHGIDVLRAFGGDVRRVHAIARKGNLTPRYPLVDNFFLNLEFTSGVIGRVSGLYGVVHPPLPMMQLGIYGSKGSLQAEFTDNAPGEIRVVLDQAAGKPPTVIPFEAEHDRSAYGHGATVIRYMRHFQECIDGNRATSPGVLDGAKAVAVGAAAWESIRTGKVVEVNNEF